MDLSIVILNYKSAKLVQYCIKGIEQASLPFNYEIIVVDNDSKDGIKSVLKHPIVGDKVKYVPSAKNGGYAHGNNLGMKHAQGKYTLILNPDIAIIDSEAITKLYNFMEENSEVAVAGPRLVNPDKSVQHSCYRFPSAMIPVYRRTPVGRLSFARKAQDHYLMKDFDHQSTRQVDWLLGACLLVRRKAVEQVGHFDERFFLYFEDVDWCRRFWQHGWKIYYVAEAEIVHYHNRLSAEYAGLSGVFSKATRIHIASGIKYFLKYFRKSLPNYGEASA